jgi:ketosteroid isomerase-like protein
VQDKEGFFGNWSNNVIAKLVPDGFTKFDFVKSVSQGDDVVWLAEGDAQGINGRYNNEYVFVFEFSEGKILSIAEYNSDLLVATRLYKQKLVADD